MHAFFSAVYMYFSADAIAYQDSIGSVFGSRQGEFIRTIKTRPTRSSIPRVIARQVFAYINWFFTSWLNAADGGIEISACWCVWSSMVSRIEVLTFSG